MFEDILKMISGDKSIVKDSRQKESLTDEQLSELLFIIENPSKFKNEVVTEQNIKSMADLFNVFRYEFESMIYTQNAFIMKSYCYYSINKFNEEKTLSYFEGKNHYNRNDLHIVLDLCSYDVLIELIPFVINEIGIENFDRCKVQEDNSGKTPVDLLKERLSKNCLESKDE